MVTVLEYVILTEKKLCRKKLRYRSMFPANPLPVQPSKERATKWLLIWCSHWATLRSGYILIVLFFFQFLDIFGGMYGIHVFINCRVQGVWDLFLDAHKHAIDWGTTRLCSGYVCEVDCWQCCWLLTAIDSHTQTHTTHCCYFDFIFGAAEDDSRESRINILHLLEMVQVLFAFGSFFNSHHKKTWTRTISPSFI